MSESPSVWQHVAIAAGTIFVLGAAAVAASAPDAVWLGGAPSGWPAAQVELVPPALALSGTRKVYLDAGHGAEANPGNLGALGHLEQDFTLSLATDVARELSSLGHFEVKTCRAPGELRAYADRLHDAQSWGADVFVSLHSDVREPQGSGFSVLWSDEGAVDLVGRRLRFAREVARALTALGLPAYSGDEYLGLYEGDATPGVFVDRHSPEKRIFVLREATMPSIIVETHNAKNGAEAQRWDEPAVRFAFARALANAIASL